MDKRLRHPNILPLYGTVSDSKFGPRAAMVCPWQENGNLSVFLEKNAMTLGSIERYRILLGILSGLSYLHRNSIIHGDLTGSNVLLGAGGVRSVRLSDFGLSRVLEDPAMSNSTVSSGSTLLGGACRWAAPETIIPSHSGGSGRQATKASDVYSFGRVMLQVFSGRIPYYHIPNQYTVLYHLYTGDGPPRSLYPHIAGNVWDLIQMCQKVTCIPSASACPVPTSVSSTPGARVPSSPGFGAFGYSEVQAHYDARTDSASG
ncbi:kinase-like domain-containing protein [Infundibulicybe gibba]|nr:kinase-like domain-containing protein [Infundibulicybe gibba]